MIATKVKNKESSTTDKRSSTVRIVEPEKILFCSDNPVDNALELKKAKEAKSEYRFKTVCKMAKEVDYFMPMEYRNYEMFQKWLDLEQNTPYSTYISETAKFAKTWAKCMQWLMNKHDKDLESIAENSLKICKSISNDYISGFRVKCAVNLLIPCWKHGDELQAWFTKKHGYDD